MKHKECSDNEFNTAMRKYRDWKANKIQLTEIKIEELFIICSKLKADATHLSGIGTGYATGLRISTTSSYKKIEQEINDRFVKKECPRCGNEDIEFGQKHAYMKDLTRKKIGMNVATQRVLTVSENEREGKNK